MKSLYNMTLICVHLQRYVYVNLINLIVELKVHSLF